VEVVQGNSQAGSPITSEDIRRFREGTHYRLYDKLGATAVEDESGRPGTYFAVWAPKARKVSVIGDFNDWDPDIHPLRKRRGSGIWEGFVPGAAPGDRYKYRIGSRRGRGAFDKADPFALTGESPPMTTSIVWKPDFKWGDCGWMENRAERNSLKAPMSVYEVHLGSWRRTGEMGDRVLTYREIAPPLAEYVRTMGFTHVEFLPVMEHPFYGSWGYQCTSYFAPTSRYGIPEDLMYLIDHLHRSEIGVILDWVPSHFPADPHSLGRFDGRPLYEHADPRRGYHPDWTSLIFNYGRPEVRSFLLSSALFWLDVYHADGLRVDGVASMLYLDFSRKNGDWIPNKYGGNENFEAIDFIRGLNDVVYREHPDVQTFAEEATAWPGVTQPVHHDGLGFGLKWDMGWMNDTLSYFSSQPKHRPTVHKKLTFRSLYSDSENFILPLSHDEVVYEKRSLLSKMPGKGAERFADLRLLLGYMYALPGKKLLFMGGEFGQEGEWSHDASLRWELLDRPEHASVQSWVVALNRLYREEPALYIRDCEPGGLRWINADDSRNSVLCFIREAGEGLPPVVVVCNFSSAVKNEYRVGVPHGGVWEVLLDSNAGRFGGSGKDDPQDIESESLSANGFEHSLRFDLPPRSILFFR